MLDRTLNSKDTIIIFFPFNLKSIHRCYLTGDFERFDDFVTIFFVTKLFDSHIRNTCISLSNESNWIERKERLKLSNDWIYVEAFNDILIVKKFKINGEFREFENYLAIWINYDFKLFSQCETLTYETCGAYCDKSYFKYLVEKIAEKKKKTYSSGYFKTVFLSFLSILTLKLSGFTLKQFSFTKYFNVTLHFDNYLNGFFWAMKTIKRKKKLDTKVINLLMSVLLDMILGILFLNWLSSKISFESFPDLFLLTAESVVNSLKDLINWLRGDPAGLKLNWAYNKILATFFLFHIDIWWTFLAYIKPLVNIIFQIFLKLGLLGITFQASITADLLALVSFHVYCIYAYAAKLYSIQIASLVSLWRLFLGLKKNPLRGKVDSCRYSPEQLFIGTLGFTILLFLLPTTLLYYVVFTLIRLVILTIQAILMVIRHFNQTLPVYSTILWFLRSPKISVGIEIKLQEEYLKSNLLLMNVKPVAHSWWETVNFFMPDCAPKSGEFNVSDLLNSLISGKYIYPI